MGRWIQSPLCDREDKPRWPRLFACREERAGSVPELGQQIVEIGRETGAFGRRMLRVPGLRSDRVGLE